jgi:hypothetical protein
VRADISIHSNIGNTNSALKLTQFLTILGAILIGKGEK